MPKLLIFIILWGVFAYANAAKIYTWTDEQGETHFSQTPPETNRNIKYEEKNIKTGKTTGTNQGANQVSAKTVRNPESDKTQNTDNILRYGETGPAHVLIKKKNPDKLYLVFTPNVNVLIKKQEARKGRKLSPKEIEEVRSTATAKAVRQDELDNYK